MSPAESHDVAGDELVDRYLDKALDFRRPAFVAPPLHACRRLYERTQLGSGLVGAVLLDEGGDDGEDDHHDNDDGGARVAEKIRHHGKREQQAIERIARAVEELEQDTGAVFACDLVRAEPPKPSLRLRVFEPDVGAVYPAKRRGRVALARSDEFRETAISRERRGLRPAPFTDPPSRLVSLARIID